MSQMLAKTETPTEAGTKSYAAWLDGFRANPEHEAIYAEESAKMALWLQLVAARAASGLTQAQVAERLRVSQAQVSRIEKRGYDAYTLNTLRRYVTALGEGFSLEVHVRSPAGGKRARRRAKTA